MKKLDKRFFSQIAYSLGYLLRFFNPYISIICLLCVWNFNMCFYVVPTLIWIMSCILLRISSKVEPADESFPKIERRFTSINEKGDISIAKEDIYEMVRYVRRIEDYTETICGIEERNNSTL